MSADHDGFFLVSFAKGQDARDEFSVQALTVEAAFSGQDEIGRCDLFLQAGHFAEKLPAGNQLGAQQMQRCADSAGGSASRQQRVQPDFCRKLLHPLFQSFQHGGIRSLLWTENHRRPARPQQRIVDVAGYRELCTLEETSKKPQRVRTFSNPAGALGFERTCRSTRPTHLRSLFERAKHPFAAVVGGAAADADGDLPAAQVEGGSHQDAQAVACRLFRIPLFGGQHRQSADLCHFDEGLLVVVEQEDRRFDRAHQGIDGRNRHPAATALQGRFDHFHRTIAPVGHRQLYDLGLGPAHKLSPDRRLQRIRHFRRRKRTLEFIGNYQNIPYLCHKARQSSQIYEIIHESLRNQGSL